ncbi:lipopolysaccharide core biosynthesis glycosyl transferase [Gluconobacter frateurii M-2]|nr:lipopolysaccharide core biosynthesis glycosyl transferase [Gluconobacter frateurii M-2]
MKILHCLSTREFAGTERHVAELTAFQARSHDVTLLLESQTADFRTGGDIAHHIASAVRIVRADWRGYLGCLARLMYGGSFDVVHTHLGQASIRAGALKKAGLTGKTPVVGTLHNAYRGRSYGGHDGLICIARWQQADLPTQWAERHALISNWTIPSRLDAQQRAVLRSTFRQKHDIPQYAFVICTMGRLVPEKRFDLLLRAWKQAALPVDTYLVLIGDGPQRSCLELGYVVQDRIIFAGYSTDAPAVFAAFDGFVLPSSREPFGLVLLEAMAAGLPVCATAAGGALDILGHDPACLVQPDDVDALSAGLRRLRRQSAQVWDLSSYDLAEQARKTEQFYHRFL